MQKYLVGGAVRDELLSLPVHERDWVVVGSTVEAMLQQGYRQVGKDFPVFLHPETNEEYALARTERKTSAGHCGFEVFSSPDTTLEDDLLRRDLTINAIAKDENDTLIDPYQGQSDIQNRILRHVSPAFSEDPLRVLRVARFAARFWSLGFTIAPETLALMTSISASGELEQLSKERIWQETKRALASDHPEIYFLILLHVGALDHIAPDLASALNKKSALLNLSMLRNIKDAQHRYTCLLLLASEADGEFNYQLAENISQCFSRNNDFQELALHVVKYFTLCCRCLQSNSEDIYNILHSLDTFRREARYLKLIQCMQSAQTIFNDCSKNALVFLTQLAPKLNAISIEEKDRLGLSGKQIGEAIKNIRIQAITEQLNALR